MMDKIPTFITLTWVIWNIYADSLIDSIHFIHRMMDAEKEKEEKLKGEICTQVYVT